MDKKSLKSHFEFASFLALILATIVVLCILLSPKGCSALTIGEAAVANARQYVGMVEVPKDSNRGWYIDELHRYFGLPYGNSYCAMFAIKQYQEAYARRGEKTPLPRIARVSVFKKWADNHPLTTRVYGSKALLWGACDVRAGDMPIWIHGSNVAPNSNWSGHVGLATGISRDGKMQVLEGATFKKATYFDTIEGNTSPGNSGDQRNGGGIYARTRGLGIGTKFQVMYFVRVNGE